LTPDRFRVTDGELDAAVAAVEPAFLRSIQAVRRRVETFARAGRRRNWQIPTPGGGWLGERFLPLRRVGVYIPGGAAPLASTALMTVPLARVAGVPEIVACTPPRADGSVDPHVLCALRLAGATEVYRVGGVPAIGAMAYGTRVIRPVEKIVGPGGVYVAAAKRLVYGDVALDMVAGPSEIAVLADDTAPPEVVAADLLSQAEHGTGRERALLVTPSSGLAQTVRAELQRQAPALGRAASIRRVLQNNAALVVAPSLKAALELVNRFAPEHLEILTRHPETVARGVTSAGAVFVGRWTPESAGDFAAGPSHVLPTGGTARFFSGLTVEDFRRRMSMLKLARADLAHMRTDIERFAQVEGLPGHARSAQIRFAEESR
jgi:histidinol dehydrogenase